MSTRQTSNHPSPSMDHLSPSPINPSYHTIHNTIHTMINNHYSPITIFRQVEDFPPKTKFGGKSGGELAGEKNGGKTTSRQKYLAGNISYGHKTHNITTCIEHRACCNLQAASCKLHRAHRHHHPCFPFNHILASLWPPSQWHPPHGEPSFF
jgi:hypothetical protein